MRKSIIRMTAFLLMGILLTGCTNQDNNKINTEQEKQTESEMGSGSMSETEETQEVVPQPVITTVTITAAGDCSLGALQYHEYAGSFHSYYDSYGENYFFERFKDIFGQDDLTIVNLECVFTDAEDRVEKEFSIKGKPEYAGILTSNSVEAVSLGNNHSQDYGPESLVDTQEALDEAGVAYAINDTIAYYTTGDGLVIAMVSASVTAYGNAKDQYLLEGVVEARSKGADLVIACCHWGIEKVNDANEYQQNLGHALIDKGADLVIGHHPHVLQGVEEYKGKVILYSLANFSFGANRNPPDKDTVVYQQTFTFVDGVLQDDIVAKMIPARVSGHDTYNDFQPAVANKEQASVIIERLNEYSKPYGGVFFDEQGRLQIKEAE